MCELEKAGGVVCFPSYECRQCDWHADCVLPPARCSLRYGCWGAKSPFGSLYQPLFLLAKRLERISF